MSSSVICTRSLVNITPITARYPARIASFMKPYSSTERSRESGRQMDVAHSFKQTVVPGPGAASMSLKKVRRTGGDCRLREQRPSCEHGSPYEIPAVYHCIVFHFFCKSRFIQPAVGNVFTEDCNLFTVFFASENFILTFALYHHRGTVQMLYQDDRTFKRNLLV